MQNMCEEMRIRMNIYTIFTGGTIGSKKDDNGVIRTGDMPYSLIDMYLNIYDTDGNDIEFTANEPYRILSENLASENILELIKAINKAMQFSRTDGIIITHGTDTLQYTASILGYVFADTDIPIVLVSGNYVLDDKRTNGLYNFKYAVDFIKMVHGKGVFVSYKNTNDMAYIHRATRLQNVVLLSDDVSSVMNSWYGRFDNDKYYGNPDYKTVPEDNSKMFDRFNVKLLDKSDEILRVMPYVGMTYPVINEKIKVILHESYHSGTIRISKELEEFASEAKKRNIPIFLTGLNSNEAEYETVKLYRSYGIIPLHESSVISQYCKLWLALSNGKDVLEVMRQSVGEDFIS